MTAFSSAYNVGSTPIIFAEDGTAVNTTITALSFRPGFDPLSYVAATDMIYTTTTLGNDGSTLIKRPQGLCFADAAAAKAYIDTI